MIINEVFLLKQIEEINSMKIRASRSDEDIDAFEALDNLVNTCNFALKALKLERIAQGMVNKCNVVTAYWRHDSQDLIDDEMMTDLYDRQLETEAALQEYRNEQRRHKPKEGTPINS